MLLQLRNSCVKFRTDISITRQTVRRNVKSNIRPSLTSFFDLGLGSDTPINRVNRVERAEVLMFPMMPEPCRSWFTYFTKNGT